MEAGHTHERGRRIVESAVLAMVIERHPDPFPRPELLAEMTAVACNPGRETEVEEAIEGLVGVGLLTQGDDFLRATPASLRAGELELGL
jgi:hypothetical protein